MSRNVQKREEEEEANVTQIASWHFRGLFALQRTLYRNQTTQYYWKSRKELKIQNVILYGSKILRLSYGT